MQIHQMNIDGSGSVSTSYDPAHCALSIRWTDRSTDPQTLFTDIKMKGISKRSFEIALDFNSEGT